MRHVQWKYETEKTPLKDSKEARRNLVSRIKATQAKQPKQKR